VLTFVKFTLLWLYGQKYLYVSNDSYHAVVTWPEDFTSVLSRYQHAINT